MDAKAIKSKAVRRTCVVMTGLVGPRKIPRVCRFANVRAQKSRPMGAASLSNQNLIHVSDGFAVNLKNHVLSSITGKNEEGYMARRFFFAVRVKASFRSRAQKSRSLCERLL